MTVEDPSNDFFGHLGQPAPPTPRKVRRPEDGELTDGANPATGEQPERKPTANHVRPAPRPPTGENQGVPVQPTRGPGLSPGIPRLNQPPAREAPRSGVVLTPGGVKRVDQTPSGPAPARRTPSGPVSAQPTPSRPVPASPASPGRTPSQPVPASPSSSPEYHEASRQRNEGGDVGWEEYAASDFPAMAAEEFGVKTKTSDSGRVVPVAVRADLTEDALKGRSIKDKGHRPRPATAEVRAPRSFIQRIGDSLRRRRPRPLADEEQSGPAEQVEEGTGKGFARSGSMPVKAKRKQSAARVAWNILVEVTKIFLLVLLLRAYVVQVSEVTGPSMQPTLHGGDETTGKGGDRLVVERITPLFAGQKEDSWLRVIPAWLRPELKRGDVVVVRSPEDPGLELVKRLIALPGDTLKFEDGKIYLKPAGADQFEEVKEPYIQADDLKNPDGTFRSYAIGDLGTQIKEGEPLLVPKDRLFIMGDNRGRSNDSRRWLAIEAKATDPPGLDRLWVHRTSVEGVVMFRIWPFHRIWPPLK